jgi:outer membrane protein TolC
VVAASGQDQAIRVDRPKGPVFVRPYKEATVPPIRMSNTDRLHSLIRANQLYLTVQDAIALATENNLNLEVARYGPLLAEWAVERQEGGGALRGAASASSQVGTVASGQGVSGSLASAGLTTGGPGNVTQNAGNSVIQQIGPVAPNFDPVFQNSTVFSHITTPQPNQFVSQTEALVDVIRNYSNRLQQGLMSGGSYYIQQNETYLKENAPTNNLNPSVAPRLNVYLQHNLLEGFGASVNSRYIRIARRSEDAAQERFRSQLLDLVASVVDLYWDVVSGNETLKARQRALDIAQKFYDDTQNEIRIGVLAPIELPRAAAEVASRRQDFIIAQAALRQQETLLKEALSRTEDPLLESAEIVPLDKIEVPEKDDLPPLRELVTRAMAKRPDVAVSNINAETAEISAIGTENGLLPIAQGLVSATNAGAAGTPQIVNGHGPNPYFEGGFGTALGQVFRRNYPSERVAAYLVVPFGNRQAQGDYGIDQLQLRQSQLSRRRSANQIVVDISNQMTALRQARSRYSAAVNTRTLSEQLLEAEQNKFSLGTSTISSLIIVQRSLVAAQTSEVTALANYQRARVSLDQVLGETLEVNNVSLK